jgi:GGDEF domain-containing protein
VGRLIREKRQSCGTPDDFIGHVGGDDFIIIAEPDRALTICRAVAADFDRSIVQYYKDIDRNAGFIVGKDRQGVMRKYPLISLTIAIVTDDGSRFTDSRDMAQKAAELKEQIKVLKGNNVVTLEEAEAWFGPTGNPAVAEPARGT